MFRNHQLLLSTALCVPLFGIQPALSQTAAAPGATGGDGGLETITVTAERRSTDVQRTPMAITAVSGEQLQAKGIQNSLELQAVTPGLTFSENANFSEPYIRGVGTDITTPGANSSVATYVDGVYQAAPYMGVQQLAAVDRVEVLKGPQGTLYGRNATGGAINIVTRDPSQDFDADVDVAYGNYNTVNASGYLSGALTDDISANLALAENRNDGYGKSLNTGRDTYFQDSQYAHAKILYQPTEDFSFLLSGQYLGQYDTDSVYTYFTKFGATPVPTLLGGRVTVDSRDIYSAYPFKDYTKVEEVSGRAIYNLGGITITSLSGYTHTDGHIFPDFVSTNIPIFDFDANDDTDRTYSEDLTATGRFDALSWIAGFSYLNENAEFDPDFTYSGLTRNASIFATVKTTSYAGFGELTYNLTDEFSATAGIRYTQDTVEQARLGYGDGAGNIFLSVPPSSKGFENATYKGVLQYSPEWGTVYAKVETGFKSGGVNALAPADYVQPEKITSYEVGAKSDLLGRRLRLNGEAFYYDYSNLQEQYTNVSTGAAYYEAAKKATVYGGELTAEALVSEELTLSAGLNLLHTRFDQFLSHGSYVLEGGIPTLVPMLDLRGNDLTHSPPVTANVGLDWNRPLPDGSSLHTSVQYYFSGKYFFDVTNRIYQSPYSLLNAQVGWDLANGKTTIGLWSRNLTNEKYISSAAVSAFGDYGEIAAPRTFGIRIAQRF
jgi:iron complex outermembrane receptor protein